jgi:hypothetical protein
MNSGVAICIWLGGHDDEKKKQKKTKMKMKIANALAYWRGEG